MEREHAGLAGRVANAQGGHPNPPGVHSFVVVQVPRVHVAVPVSSAVPLKPVLQVTATFVVPLEAGMLGAVRVVSALSVVARSAYGHASAGAVVAARFSRGRE